MSTVPQDAGRATRASANHPSDSRRTPRVAVSGERPDGTLALLLHPTRLHDIANAEAFVQRTIDRAGINYSPDEREELLAEGLVILYDLAKRYKPLPARPGVDKQAGRFSGYAAMFLPRRLGDAWHRWHPEHRYVTDPDTGRRHWQYDPPAISLDGLTSSNTDDTTSHALDRALSRARGVRDFVPTTGNGPRALTVSRTAA